MMLQCCSYVSFIYFDKTFSKALCPYELHELLLLHYAIVAIFPHQFDYNS